MRVQCSRMSDFSQDEQFLFSKLHFFWSDTINLFGLDSPWSNKLALVFYRIEENPVRLQKRIYIYIYYKFCTKISANLTAPQAAPSDFKFRHVDASTFNCSWTPPPREKSHGTIQSYDVSYQTKVAGRRKRAVTTINTKTPYALLPGLTVCYVYEVSVRAITVGPGPYSAMVPIANGVYIYF